jgi:hypothetical protein
MWVRADSDAICFCMHRSQQLGYKISVGETYPYHLFVKIPTPLPSYVKDTSTAAFVIVILFAVFW